MFKRKGRVNFFWAGIAGVAAYCAAAAVAVEPMILDVRAQGDVGGEVKVLLREFAEGEKLQALFTETGSLRLDDVAILYGGDAEGYAIASKVSDLLRAMGLRPQVLGDLAGHTVARNHIEIILGGAWREKIGKPQGDQGPIRALHCSSDEHQVFVLLSEQWDAEIQTYTQTGGGVVGELIHGRWGADGGTVQIYPIGRRGVVYRPSQGCLVEPPNGSNGCIGTLQWDSGDSVPALMRCDLQVREMVFED